MASLYRKPIVRTDAHTGVRTKTFSEKWWGQFKDATGRLRRHPLSADKRIAQAMLANLVRRVEREKAGLIDPEDRQRQRPLGEHLEDYRAHLTDRGVTAKQVREATSHIRRMIEACRWRLLSDINAHAALSYLGERRRQGWSAQTHNHHLKSAKAFCRWLLRERRNVLDPLAHLSRLNVATDRRHDRRALAPEEFQRLVQAASTGPVVEGLVGPDRAMMYVLAAWTGLRKGEIGSLSLQSLALEADPPTATVAAGFSKRRRRDVLVLHPDLVTELRTWLGKRPPGTAPTAPLFPVSSRVPGCVERKTHKMMRLDLASAREVWLAESATSAERQQRESSDFLKYVDHSGRYADFHSCRHLFITSLERARVSPRMAQALARHSDIRLTLQTYTHLELSDQCAAIRTLPGPLPSRDAAGT